MTKASDNDFPSVLLTEQGSAPSSPAASHQRLYIRTSDHTLVTVNSSGTVTPVSSGGGSGTFTTVKDEGSNLSTAVVSLDFVGPYVAATGTTAATATIGPVFKRTNRHHAGNLTTTSASKTPIDSTNLAYLTVSLAVNDIVRCTLSGSVRVGAATGFDFEVDQPTSANVYMGGDYGCGTWNIVTSRTPICIVGTFIATEAGTHGFRPVWLTDSGTATFCNAASGNDDTDINFIVEKLGPSS